MTESPLHPFTNHPFCFADDFCGARNELSVAAIVGLGSFIAPRRCHWAELSCHCVGRTTKRYEDLPSHPVTHSPSYPFTCSLIHHSLLTFSTFSFSLLTSHFSSNIQDPKSTIYYPYNSFAILLKVFLFLNFLRLSLLQNIENR